MLSIRSTRIFSYSPLRAYRSQSLSAQRPISHVLKKHFDEDPSVDPSQNETPATTEQRRTTDMEH
jgi:hypothetical protein